MSTWNQINVLPVMAASAVLSGCMAGDVADSPGQTTVDPSSSTFGMIRRMIRRATIGGDRGRRLPDQHRTTMIDRGQH
jgi:hypothetical protein